jgi:hypothetical protein
MFFTFSGLNTRLDTVNTQLLLIGIVVPVGGYSPERRGLRVSRSLKRRK